VDGDVNRDTSGTEGIRDRIQTGDDARPRIWPPVAALLVLAAVIWVLLERIAPPGAFGG
jgi:hypothetical protein